MEKINCSQCGKPMMGYDLGIPTSCSERSIKYLKAWKKRKDKREKKEKKK
jgi:hypothetical protein